MTTPRAIAELSDAELTALEAELSRELELQAANRLSLDLTRGKPAADQLDLSDALDDAIAGNYIASDGTDSRNYGALTGLREAKELGAEIMEADPEDIICWGNSSLQLMHTSVDLALNRDCGAMRGVGAGMRIPRCWPRFPATTVTSPSVRRPAST